MITHTPHVPVNNCEEPAQLSLLTTLDAHFLALFHLLLLLPPFERVLLAGVLYTNSRCPSSCVSAPVGRVWPSCARSLHEMRAQFVSREQNIWESWLCTRLVYKNKTRSSKVYIHSRCYCCYCCT